MMNWAGEITEEELIGFIKVILANFRGDEVQCFKSTFTSEARIQLLHPEKAVSRPRPVPAGVGWWNAYRRSDIISMDCEMVACIVGSKANGSPRCVQKAAVVSVSSYDRKIIFKRTIYHEPKNVYLTPTAKRLTGFSQNSFVNGIPLETVQKELTDLFQGKLIVMIGSGSDFSALNMNKGDFKEQVFDLHEYFKKDTGKIGLRSLVMHYFQIDIQKKIHDPDVDAMYTMRMFTDIYMIQKQQVPQDAQIRGSVRLFNEIKTIK